MRPATRRARAVLGVLAACMALVVVTGPVAAASPQSATIASHVSFNPDGPNSGDFAITGTAADSGLVCAHGTFVDTGIHFAGYQSDRAGRSIVQLQVYKTFTCGDGSGSFFVKMQIQADFAPASRRSPGSSRAARADYPGTCGEAAPAAPSRTMTETATPTPSPGS